MYLLFGAQQALLIDTGARPPAGETVPIRETVDALIQEWSAAQKKPLTQLIVAHTHSHGDHVAGDFQFADRPNTRVVEPQLDAVRRFFGFPNWPEGVASLNLGGQMLTVFPIPGHEEAHIAVYDNDRQFLLTRDTLYPGLLTVDDWPSYRQSAARLFEFTRNRNVSIVLGAHIEMKDVPRQLFPCRARSSLRNTLCHSEPITYGNCMKLVKAWVTSLTKTSTTSLSSTLYDDHA